MRRVFEAMRGLHVPIEIALSVLCGWTLAYHASLLLGLPAGVIVWPFLVLVLSTSVALGPGWVAALRGTRWRSPTVIVVVVLSVVVGGLTTVLSRPDNDDFSYFHSALYQLEQLDRPVITTDTVHNVEGLPALSPLHVATSWELFIAVGASTLGLDPIHAYQNLAALAAGMLFPLIYVLWYRQFGLSPLAALVSTVGAVVFLIIDGGVHRSFGNMGFVRLWQGKAVLFTLILPLQLLYGRRFLSHPSRRCFLLLSMVAVCGVGLSSAAVYLIPIGVLCLCLSHLLSYGFSRKRSVPALALNLSAVYCSGIAAAVIVGWIPRPVDTRAWFHGWPTDWLGNLGLVIGDVPTLCRNLLLVVLPAFALRKPLARFPIMFSSVVVLLCLNPLVAPFWFETIYPASYWRLLYFIPLPWCAGLIWVAGARAVTRGGFAATKRWAAVGLVIAAFAAGVVSFEAPVTSGATRWKSPTEYKFRPPDLAFARSMGKKLSGASLLAPERVLVVLALLDPTIKLETARRSDQQTQHVFSNAGREEEGARRVLAQEVVSKGKHSPRHLQAFQQSLSGGVTAVITSTSSAALVEQLLAQDSLPWVESARDANYVLFTSDGSKPK